MAVPADYGTPKRLIKMALQDCGKLAKGAEPSSADYADGMTRLADLLYFHQTQGLKLWLLEDITVPLVSGTALYTFGPAGTTVMRKPFRVEFGYATTGTEENRREIDPISYQDWTRLSNITQEGQVTQYFVDKRLDTLNVYLWLVPDDEQVDNGAVHLVMRTKASQMENLVETMTFPPEWYLALRWNLAYELATGQPTAVQQRCMNFSERYIDALQNFDIEDVSVNIQPDYDVGSTGNFT